MKLRAIQGWGEARIFRQGVESTAASGDKFVSVVVEFVQRANGFRQRVEFRSFHEEDVSRVKQMVVGATLKFYGEIDAQVMIGTGNQIFANPRVTGRIERIDPPEKGVRYAQP